LKLGTIGHVFANVFGANCNCNCKLQLQTEHDRPGAVGGPAEGYVLKHYANRNSARPKAGSPKAPGR